MLYHIHHQIRVTNRIRKLNKHVYKHIWIYIDTICIGIGVSVGGNLDRRKVSGVNFIRGRSEEQAILLDIEGGEEYKLLFRL